MLKACEMVWWKTGEDYHVGRLLRLVHPYGDVITRFGGARTSTSLSRFDSLTVLVRHNRTCTETESVVEEFVPWCDLHHYYGDKQQEGLQPHHVSLPRFTPKELDPASIENCPALYLFHDKPVNNEIPNCVEVNNEYMKSVGGK